MQIVEIECSNCRKKLLVYDQYIREKMFCTLGCMSKGGDFLTKFSK